MDARRMSTQWPQARIYLRASGSEAHAVEPEETRWSPAVCKKYAQEHEKACPKDLDVLPYVQILQKKDPLYPYNFPLPETNPLSGKLLQPWNCMALGRGPQRSKTSAV